MLYGKKDTGAGARANVSGVVAGCVIGMVIGCVIGCVVGFVIGFVIGFIADLNAAGGKIDDGDAGAPANNANLAALGAGGEMSEWLNAWF